MPGFVVGYDGSEDANAALTRALELGEELKLPVVVAFGFDSKPVGGELTDWRAAVQEHARSVLAQASEAAQAKGVEVETVIAEDDPAPALVALGQERDARAIVVGTRGEGPWRGALIGSTAHKLLHLTDRPVLVVPSPDRRD